MKRRAIILHRIWLFMTVGALGSAALLMAFVAPAPPRTAIYRMKIWDSCRSSTIRCYSQDLFVSLSGDFITPTWLPCVTRKIELGRCRLDCDGTTIGKGDRSFWAFGLRLHLAEVALASAIYPTITIVTFLIRRYRNRIPEGHCQKCRYDLTGNKLGVCPECGTTLPDQYFVERLAAQRSTESRRV